MNTSRNRSCSGTEPGEAEEGRERVKSTWKFPWVELVEIDLGDDGDGDGVRSALANQVMVHQLVVRGVEPEPRRQLQLRLLHLPSLLSTLSDSVFLFFRDSLLRAFSLPSSELGRRSNSNMSARTHETTKGVYIHEHGHRATTGRSVSGSKR